MKVLVFSPHPDDESIGLGGTIRLHVLAGDTVFVDFITSGETAPDCNADLREREALEAKHILGYQIHSFYKIPDGQIKGTDKLFSLIETSLDREPDIIYIPYIDDSHRDHQMTHVVVMEAIRKRKEDGRKYPRHIAAYEVWTPLKKFTKTVQINEVVQDKLSAVRAHASQDTRNGFAMGILGLNRYRSVMNGKPNDYFEVFDEVKID